MISPKKKKALYDFHDGICEDCRLKGELKKLKIEESEIHRINPELGYSNHRNLKFLCKKHHSFYSSAQRIVNGIQN